MNADPSADSSRLNWKDLHVSTGQVLDLLVDAVCVVDEEGRYLYASAAFESIFGYAPHEVLGRRMIELVHPDDRQRTLDNVRNVMNGVLNTHFENRYVRKDGRIVHVMWSARWVPGDRVRIAVARNVTELKRAEAKQSSLYAIAQASQSAEDLVALYRHIHEIVGRLMPASNFYVALYDRAQGLLTFPYHIDRYDPTPPPQPLNADSYTAEVVRRAEPLLVTQETRDSEVPGAGHAALDWLGVPLITADGVIGALVVQSYSGDVRYSAADMELLQFVSGQVASAIQRKQMDAQLQHSAMHDHLTDLPNRELLRRRLEQALAQAGSMGQSVALLYIDLDDFKQVNDTRGHAVGDRLLQQMARRLSECVRRSDTVARMGGDEFVVLLADVENEDVVDVVGDKLRAQIARPFEVGEHVLRVSASIGCAIGAPGRDNLERLLNRADQAMYRAKGQGGGRLSHAPRDAD